MELKTEFCIYRAWDKKTVADKVTQIVNTIEGFTTICPLAPWTNLKGDCVYIHSLYNAPASGDKIPCSGLKKVITKWFADVAKYMQDSPETGFVDDEDSADDPKDDYAHSTYECVISSFLEVGMRIEIKDQEGEVQSLTIVMANGINPSEKDVLEEDK